MGAKAYLPETNRPAQRFGGSPGGPTSPNRQALEAFGLLQFVANRGLFFVLGATGAETV